MSGTDKPSTSSSAGDFLEKGRSSPTAVTERLYAGNQQAAVSNRLDVELKQLEAEPAAHASAAPSLEKHHVWHCVIEGPADSLYSEGVFFVDLHFPEDYPFSPPQIIWRTRIYHCNINSRGVVFHQKLNREWVCTMTIRDILNELVQLLYVPRPQDVRPVGVSPVVALYNENKKLYEEKAREWTKRYAW